MKVVCLIALALCAVAHAEDNVVDRVQGHLGSLQVQLHHESPDNAMSDYEKLASEELAALERTQERNIVGDLIISVLESLRPIIINGNDVIPPLDPLNIQHIGPVSVSATGIRITANLHNFRAEGLGWYVVEDASFNTLRLQANVKMLLPRLTFTGSYDANALITLLQHNAGGNFRVFLNRLDIEVDVRLGASIFGGNLFLRELDINADLADISIDIHGMVGSSILNNLINSIVQSTVQNVVQDQMSNITQMISEALFDVIDSILRDFTLDDLLGG